MQSVRFLFMPEIMHISAPEVCTSKAVKSQMGLYCAHATLKPNIPKLANILHIVPKFVVQGNN
jgi:hypothetical protein